ncbi:hypothetical protein [Shinella sp. NM-101]|uniref:hypothetical protein n=1 Tax=Shinella sp. NM-101 TaxID=2744455 RepID=UPI001F2B1CB8|nr:hypothetical protein [Shinella sp. NM-101]
MHDDDLIYFDLIQVTKPSTHTHFPWVFRAAPGQDRAEIRRCLPQPFNQPQKCPFRCRRNSIRKPLRNSAEIVQRRACPVPAW